MQPTLRFAATIVHENWRKNHRHHGLFAALRCANGMRQLRASAGRPAKPERDEVDCVTFSVVPNLTGLWAKVMQNAIPGGKARIWIGDCSGGFGPTHHFAKRIHAKPLINYLHGLKLDLFFQKFVRSEFFVISDDDVFWVDDTPWRWAMEQFQKDPKLAVVSLVPRMRFTWDLGGKEHQPMGSYCLVIRREIWLNERLSFEAVREPSPSKGSYEGLYDTCDFANVELIKRGYNIAIAPPEIRDHLAAFKGVSSATLRIQKDPGGGYAKVYDDGPIPIVETCLVARELKQIVAAVAPAGHCPDLMDPELMDRAERELAPMLTPEERTVVEARVQSLTARIARGVLDGASNASAAGARSR
jgi:hypothetical protein